MASPEPATEARSGRPDPPPPLRIHHLLACGAVAAVTLTVWKSWLPAELSDQPPAVLILSSIDPVLSAVALTLGVFSIYWHAKGYASLAQPGQWLLIGQVILTLRYLRMLIPFFRRPDILNKNLLHWNLSETAIAVAYLAYVTVSYLLPVVFFAWCAWRIADTRAWRILFAIIALGHAIPTWMVFMFVGPPLVPPFSTIWVELLIRNSVMLVPGVWAMIGDYLQSRPRVWTHWVGTALFVISHFVIALGIVAYWLELL